MKLGVFSIFAILSLAYADFDIQNCEGIHYTWVQNALEDAEYLAGRATQTLEEALNWPYGIPTAVQIILDAFLSEEATMDTYLLVLGK